MKKSLVLALWMLMAGLPAWAQSNAATGAADLEAERNRLATERAAIEARYESERKACYARFAVEDCLRESRARRRTENDHLKRQESSINDIERQRRGAAELRKLDEKKTTERPQDSAQQREQSMQNQREREQRAADHAQGRAATAAEAPERQRQFDQKQSNQAAEQAKAAQRRAEAPEQAQRYEEKQRKAEEHRASRERQNANRTKPRGAPLPPAEPAAPKP